MDPQLLWHLQELLRRTGWLADRQLRLESRLQGLETRMFAVEGQLQAVESSLLAVEGSLRALEERLAGLEDRPATHIDKIEYNFEQLKVDTLSGTLQIGLASGAEGLIEDLNAGSATGQDLKLGPLQGDSPGEPYVRILAALDEYVAAGLYRDIDELAAEAGWDWDGDPGLRERIAMDLEKQIRDRVTVYMKELPTRDGPDDGAVKAVLSRIRDDVRSGLKQYYSQEGEGNEP